MAYRVLVVCVANRSRSASVKIFLEHVLKHHGMHNIEVDSAGVDERFISEKIKAGDSGANPYTRYVLDKSGYHEILDHRMKAISKDLVENSNLILAASTDIKNEIIKRFPQARHKTMTMRGYALGKEGDLPGNALDIDDPHEPKAGLYRGKIEPRGLRAHYLVAREMKRIAVKIGDRLKKDLFGR